MAMDSGVHTSLYPTVATDNFAKFDLKVFLSNNLWENYVAFFSSKLWSHKESSWIVDWEAALIDLDVNEQGPAFNNTITNIIMPNFVSNEIIICDDCDPPWMKTPPCG